MIPRPLHVEDTPARIDFGVLEPVGGHLDQGQRHSLPRMEFKIQGGVANYLGKSF